MLLNKVKFLNNRNFFTSFPVAARSFLSAPFPELSALPKSIDSYEKLHKFSIENSELFWSTVAKSRIDWIKDFDKVTSGSFSDKEFNLKWFINGKINVSSMDRYFLWFN